MDKGFSGPDFVAGIDVGGTKKGFHVALLNPVSESLLAIHHLFTPEKVCETLEEISARCLAIAIDCPPRFFRPTKTVRAAELELHQSGYRIQWTPEKDGRIQEWMKNGGGLWRCLRKRFLAASFFETFPTASSDALTGTQFAFPLKLLAGKEKRRFYKDYLDAIICALAAGSAVQGKTKIFGKGDVLGPIHVLCS